jgi:hypothetical protein
LWALYLDDIAVAFSRMIPRPSCPVVRCCSVYAIIQQPEKRLQVRIFRITIVVWVSRPITMQSLLILDALSPLPLRAHLFQGIHIDDT